MRHNPFDHYSSRNARINILLENFHFFHRPTTSGHGREGGSQVYR